jgi:hypothetical protein
MFEQRARCRREEQALDPAVVRIGPAFDQAAVGELIEQPGERDGYRAAW